MWDSLMEPWINTLNSNISDLQRGFLGDGMPEDFEALVKGDEVYAAEILRSLAEAATKLAEGLEMESAAADDTSTKGA